MTEPASQNPLLLELRRVADRMDFILQGVGAWPPDPSSYAMVDLVRDVKHLSLTLYEYLSALPPPYDWPTWAKDTEPKSAVTPPDIAGGVLKGIDRLLDRWRE